MPEESLIQIEKVSHRYGDRTALDEVSFSVTRGEIFGLLGPNGGGKTTLFRILCTLLPIQSGRVSLLGKDLADGPREIRQQLGVVFQSPSLDKKLTVAENLKHQGHLFGLSGSALENRSREMLDQMKIWDRKDDIVEKLSGGLQRRVELAKALLHRPRLIILDEPTTGLDPGARRDLWDHLTHLRKTEGVTLLVTTHLMDEGERCDRLGVLDNGKLIALDTPEKLRGNIGGEVIRIQAREPQKLADEIQAKFGGEPKVLDDAIRMEQKNGHAFTVRLAEAFPGRIDSMTVGRPTLEDVFIRMTGHRFWNEPAEDAGNKKKGGKK